MSTNFPHGLRSRGVPVDGGGERFTGPWATHYFVDVLGNDGNTGKDPDSSLKTIQAAVDKMVVGDVLYIRPQTYVVGTGHARYTENITVGLTQSDLSIIGAAYNQNNEFKVRLRSTSGYTLNFNGPSSHIENLGMISAGTGNFIYNNNGATNTQRGSDGPTMVNCHFKEGADEVTGGQSPGFYNCRFHYTTGGLTIATPSVSSFGLQMQHCNFLDNNGAIQTGPYVTWSGAHAQNVWIDRCTFGRKPTNHYINVGGTLSTGQISNCSFNISSSTLNTDFPGIANNANFHVIGCWDATDTLIA